jgi:hypothetical protein
MADTAEGQHDGIQPNAGPTSKFDGVAAHPEVDGKTEMTVTAGEIRQPWQTGQGAAPESSGFALGKNRPD